MPCASIACARSRNAVRFSRRSIIRGCWPARRRAPAAPSKRWTTTSCSPSWRVRQARPTSPNLRHVRTAPTSARPRKSPTARTCEDFDTFKPLFEQVQKDLEAGLRQTRPLRDEGRNPDRAVLHRRRPECLCRRDGRDVHERAVANVDARLRVIFDNGTESNLLLRSLQRALHKDEAGRRITDPVAGPLFADESEDGDLASGTIYVLRSKSDHPHRRSQSRRSAQDRRHGRRRRTRGSPMPSSTRPS